MGIEPTTSPLPREYSTTELHQPESDFGLCTFLKNGAQDGSRTRNPQLGRLIL
jgi:hypothetical protein